MDSKLRDEIRARLVLKESPARMREELIQSGFSEVDVDTALKAEADMHVQEHSSNDKHNNRVLAFRELIVRAGYGAASPQFINILFSLSGAGLFLLGLINGLRTIISMLFSGIMQEYAKVHKVSKNTISVFGIVFGFSFLFMAFALSAHWVWLYALGMLLAGLGVVAYGDLYNKFISETLRREKMGGLLRRMGQYGVLVTMASMLVSGWIIDYFPVGTAGFELFGRTFVPVGYLLSFEITAFAFIIGGYLLSLLKGHRAERRYRFTRFCKEHLSVLRGHIPGFFKNRYTTLLILSTIIAGLLEVLGQSYYGLYIYKEFQGVMFGGFLNVAVLYGVAILVSFLGPWFTRKLQRAIGLSPMLVFGTLLTAFLPFILVYNPHFFAVGAALVASVVGAAIVGFAQGLLARKLMDEETRKRYFMSLGLVVAIPYLILLPIGAWLTAQYGMPTIFLAIGVGLVFVVAPLYFILVAMANKDRL